MIRDKLLILQECIRNFQTTGEVFPTSRWAAQALIRPLSIKNRQPLRVIEVGCGTGPVSLPLLAKLQDKDELWFCEINPKLMSFLRKKLKSNEHYRKHQSRVHFFEGPVQELPECGKFDVIVCAIPFANLDIDTVKSIFDKFRQISHGDTVMTYYEYMGMKRLARLMLSDANKIRVSKLEQFFKTMHERSKIGTDKVWLNILPINIHTVKTAA